ncbi:FMN-binding negative transcriptional regulator [Vitreoscilla massiliensis]|uniref:FMN-binding negative transcriptional regulator n=1 Tax=Vitreoscilla massiliensis TaxID=1689272 RepID=A0ABY4E5D2_9NEIS|nr:FMN-binding negative transcriptional regulator [Vitreoscilla massiliensis]UOO90976.1 FMN-binding negative transcriptional regulator [Vitreoscilla massiliensis]
MHCPKVFEEHRAEILLTLLQQYPLATVISHADAGLEVNLLPMLLQQRDGKAYLLGHMAKNNAQLQALAHSDEVLWLFQGPNAYVSPAWYPSKQEHGKVVPTWNYIMVEVRGKVRLFDDAEALLQVVQALTTEHELGRAQPWQVSDAPSAYITAQLRGIVGIEVEITSMRGKFKLSQNRSEEDQAGVCAGMAAEQPAHGMLAWMPTREAE